MDKTPVRDLGPEELKAELAAMGEPAYRAGQILRWLYRKGARDFASMSDLPAGLRERLAARFALAPPAVGAVLAAPDGTEKAVLVFPDGCRVETVFIPAGDRGTACLSTQAGCRFACAFCASGARGFVRNLTAGEILEQAVHLRFSRNLPVTNVVFMGMGEPLDNYDALMRAIERLNGADGMNIAARRITVSTCGLVPGIERLASAGLQVNLSISLHAASDELRSGLMPVNRRYGLERLIAACEEYRRATGRMVTLEYLLARGVNDRPEDARALAEIAARLRAKVNLIACNPVVGKRFAPSDERRVESFRRILEERRVNVVVRRSHGRSIGAACGQLAGAPPSGEGARA